MIWKKELKADCFTAPDIKGKNKINGDIAVCDISVHFFLPFGFCFFSENVVSYNAHREGDNRKNFVAHSRV